MATIECECGTRFDIAPAAMRVTCPNCQRRFTIPQLDSAQLDEALAMHSQMSSTMLQDLPVVTNIEQHYAQSVLAVGMSIPAEAVAMAGAAVSSGMGLVPQRDSTVPSLQAGKSTKRTGSHVSDARMAASANETTLTPGEMLLDRYEVQRKIGQGGMSSVYEAHDHVRDEAVALKVLLPHLLRMPRMQERFLQEGRISSNFSHPNIARVYDLHQTESQLILSMELLHGTTLRYDMHRRKQQGQQYRASEVVHILSQICDALSLVHSSGVVHRDLKPENLWLGLDGTVKVMDFGIARDATRGAHTTGPRGSGTPYYIAPEQLTASRMLDHRADQYSLAVIAYELLTGDIPQGAVEPPHVKNSQIPKRLSQAIFRAMDADPSKRFASVENFQSAMQFNRRMPMLAKAALASLLLAGLGSGSYAFARWGMPLLEPKQSPVWNKLEPHAIKEREAIKIAVKAPDATLTSPALEFQLLNDAPAGASIDSDGVIHWTPTENQAPKKHKFKVMALVSENGQTHKEEQTVEIDVGEVYDPPMFDTPSATKAIEHKELVFDVVAKDPNDPQLGLRYELVNPPAGMTIDARTGRIRWTPGEEQGGAHLDIPIRVSLASEDQREVSTTRRLLIDVEESIDNLTFTSSERISAAVGQPISLRVLSHDPNVPLLNTFYRLRGGDRLGLTIDPQSGQLTWTPGEDSSGKSYEVTVEACRDDAGKIEAVGQQTLKINVAEYKPEPPPKAEPEAPSPSDAASRTTVPTNPRPAVPINTIPSPSPGNVPTGQAGTGTCPTTGGSGRPGGQPNPGQPNPGQPNPGQPNQPLPGNGNSGSCPKGGNSAGQGPIPHNQVGSVIVDVVEKAVKIHQQKEQAKKQGNPQPLPIQTVPKLPTTSIPGQVFKPANGNTGIAGGLNRPQPKPNAAPSGMNQSQSLQSMLKQKIEQEMRNRQKR